MRRHPSGTRGPSRPSRAKARSRKILSPNSCQLPRMLLSVPTHGENLSPLLHPIEIERERLGDEAKRGGHWDAYGSWQPNKVDDPPQEPEPTLDSEAEPIIVRRLDTGEEVDRVTPMDLPSEEEHQAGVEMDTVQPQADLDTVTDSVTRSVDTPSQQPADDEDTFLDSDSEVDALLLANNKFDHPYSDSHVNDDGCRDGSSRGHSTGAGSLWGHSDDYRGGFHTHVVEHSDIIRSTTRPHEARYSYNEITRASSRPHEARHSDNIKVIACNITASGAVPPKVKEPSLPNHQPH